MRSLIVSSFLWLLLSGQTVIAQSASLRTKHFLTQDGLALSGYDPVSYFQKKPKKGLKTYQLTHDGVTYRFTSAANLEVFKKNPAAYEPQYGGWCAYAMGKTGEKVEVDPETYKIVEGKLYLFYNKLFNNTLPDWNDDEASLKKRADANWNKLYR
jgi:YHS domain-containing protein